MIYNNWVFGDNCGLDFSTSPAPPLATTGFSILTTEGCASISNDNGDLLFYTDGITICDSTNTVRATGLLGNHSSTQSALIVPDPSNQSQYYVFTADGSTGNENHFNGGVINVDTWTFTPLSSLINLPSTFGFSAVEKIIAIQHENCEDFWVITILQDGGANFGSGVMRIYLVSSLNIQHFSDTPMNVNITDIGYMKANADGSMIAIANYGDNSIYVIPFDIATGAIDLGGLCIIIALTTTNYGIEFSPDGLFLYYGDEASGDIYQVELVGALVSNLIGNISGNAGALQLASDNRIYIAKGGQPSVAAILDPNIQGSGCNLNDSFITFPAGSSSHHGLPNLISNICIKLEEPGKPIRRPIKPIRSGPIGPGKPIRRPIKPIKPIKPGKPE